MPVQPIQISKKDKKSTTDKINQGLSMAQSAASIYSSVNPQGTPKAETKAQPEEASTPGSSPEDYTKLSMYDTKNPMYRRYMRA